ncbi:MAG TPA: transposase family protein [Candidatus Acidoferrum sp.]|nr:transposase family protein [Candidatus Acidoferrum sp.]
MKDQETKERFMVLRAKGKSFSSIAQELNVSKQTLINWARDLRGEIDNLESIEVEALREKYSLTTQKRLEFLGENLNKIKSELESRDLSEIPTDRLLTMYFNCLKQLQAELRPLDFKSDEEITHEKMFQII